MINKIKCNVCVLLAAAVCFALGACSGEEGDSMPQVPANPDALCAITPHTIAISPVDVSQTPVTRSEAGEPEQKATFAVNLGHNYAAEGTLEAAPQEAQTRAGASLAADAQYRIVIFDGTGAIVGNVVYKQGSTAVVAGEAIRLKAGTYRLFAYTFNSASAIRALDADNKNVTVNGGDDFMTYTDANYTVTSTDYGSGKQLNISFVRQCARLTVVVVADGYTSNSITAASLTIGSVFGSGSCKWNGIANTDGATLPSVAGTTALTKASADGTSIFCGPDAGNQYLITSPCLNQVISVSGMNVNISGAGSKALGTFQLFDPVTLAKGGTYKLTITVCNYYVLTRTNPVTIDGVKWARTNLLQTGAGATAPVSFVANPWDYGSLWNWGMRDATLYGPDIYPTLPMTSWINSTSGHINQDPCRSLGGSVWRLPTYDELQSLLLKRPPTGTKVKINGVINTTDGWGSALNAKGLVSINSGREVLFLPTPGYRLTNGTINGLGNSGIYWANSGGGPGEYSAIDGGNCLQLNVNLGYNMMNYFARSQGHSLRCVRD